MERRESADRVGSVFRPLSFLDVWKKSCFRPLVHLRS